MKRWCEDEDDEISEVPAKKVMLVERNSEPCGLALVNDRAAIRNPPNHLIHLATSIQQADTAVYHNAFNKLNTIAHQIQFLQQQAKTILRETKTNQELHHVACNFVKVIGNTYHLYKRPTGQLYFSMISPEEWNDCPNEFRGSFRLEQDQSWTPIENIKSKDDNFALLNKILQANDIANILCTSENMVVDI